MSYTGFSPDFTKSAARRAKAKAMDLYGDDLRARQAELYGLELKHVNAREAEVHRRYFGALVDEIVRLRKQYEPEKLQSEAVKAMEERLAKKRGRKGLAKDKPEG